MIAGDPGQGGATWAILQYVLGLRRLGHDVWLVEPVDELTPSRTRYFEAVTAQFDLGERAALVCGRTAVGVPYSRLTEATSTSDLILNVSGMLTDECLLAGPRLRAWLDLDPCFNQLWHESGTNMRFAAHDRFVTIGQRLGCPGCDVPTCGYAWTTTLPPVVLEHWRPGTDIAHDGLTTVANWRSYGSIERHGVRYGQKAHSVRALIGLPRLTTTQIAPALAIHEDEREDLVALVANGWRILDPVPLTGTPSGYRTFVRQSRAELGIAKEGYVVSRCGWFSDRSACYLAAGRPVIGQDTGAGVPPPGEGLLTFSSSDDAAGAIESVLSDYARHTRAARGIAEEHLDSDRVLSALLEAL